MKHRRERRQRIRARCHHFPHHVHLDGTDIPQCHLNIIARVRINLSQLLLQQLARLLDSHVAQKHRPHIINVHIAVGRDTQAHRVLARTPHVDNDLITRSQTVVFRRSHILVRLECQSFNVENISSEHIVLIGRCRRQIVALLHTLLHVVRPDTLILVRRTLRLFLAACCRRFPCPRTGIQLRTALPRRGRTTRCRRTRVLRFQSQQLLLSGSFGQQLHRNGLLVLALLKCLLHIFYYLAVGHSALGIRNGAS